MNMGTQGLSGSVAFITGAAQGIGYAMAEELSRKGCVVVIADIQEEKGESAAAALRAKGVDSRYAKVDLRSAKEIQGAIEKTGSEFGRLDILINNARPRLRTGSLAETIDQWDLAMDVILKAPAVAAKCAFPMLKTTRGRIINILSTNAFFISHQPAAYHVAKAGLAHLTKYLACEYGPHGVTVNAICPALVTSPDRPALTTDQLNREAMETAVPLRRAATAADIANALVFLCGVESSYMNGHVLTIDGGLSLVEQFHAAREGIRRAGQASGKVSV
jgi:NAD(P)-dependent dehydrogenase (short-subunit alcohol dehydrogenase family)